MSHKILVVDDDASLTSVVSAGLEEAGYQVQIASGGLEGLQQLYQWKPDLVILDVMMPGMDGWETCRRIRQISSLPILMLTARGGEADELVGLGTGADLYMPKPFSMAVLVARIDALLRRSRMAKGGAKEPVVLTGDLKIDLSRREVWNAGNSVELSPTEFRLLAVLATNLGEIVTHQELLTQVWGPEYVGEDPYLKLYVRYLRQKIETDPARPRYIVTKRGVGYSLCAL